MVAAATIGLTARLAPAGTATARTGQACRGALAVPSQGRTSPNDRFGTAGDRPAQSVEPVFSQAVGEVGELGGAQRRWLARLNECVVQRNGIVVGAEPDQQPRYVPQVEPLLGPVPDPVPVVEAPR